MSYFVVVCFSWNDIDWAEIFTSDGWVATAIHDMVSSGEHNSKEFRSYIDGAVQKQQYENKDEL